MKLTKVSNINVNGTKTIFVKGEINEDMANEIVRKIEFFNSFGHEEGIERIVLAINSQGGAILPGLDIISAMDASGFPVDTHITGVAASMAGVIAVKGQRRFMNDTARLMLHSASIPNQGSNTTQGQKEAIKQLQAILAKIFSNNSKKSESEMKSTLEREVWLDAELALSFGFIDEVIDTGRAEELNKRIDELVVNNSIAEILNKYTDLIEGETINKNKMKDVKNFLKLNEDASEENVLAEVKNMNEANAALTTERDSLLSDIDALKAEKLALTEERDSFKTKADDMENETIVGYVENCIENGIFDEAKKDDLIAQAKNDFDGFKLISENIKPVHNDITKVLKKVENGNSVIPKELQGKSLRELEKAAPRLVANLVKNNAEVYNKLYKDQYGIERQA